MKDVVSVMYDAVALFFHQRKKSTSSFRKEILLVALLRSISICGTFPFFSGWEIELGVSDSCLRRARLAAENEITHVLNIIQNTSYNSFI